jgi:predicted TIM-barrel fold metal-dependent hydrolase
MFRQLSRCFGVLLFVSASAPNGITAQTPSARSQIVPVVDAHQHLTSPEIQSVWAGPPTLPPVAVSPEIAALLEERARFWNDATNLAKLYTPDAVLQMGGPSSMGWLHGAKAIAIHLSDGRRFQRAYRYVPVHFDHSGDVASVEGNIEYLDGRVVGYVHLSLARTNKVWRISGETPIQRRGGIRPTVDGAQLVAALDSTGIQRAAVLSVAFLFASATDPQRIGSNADSLYALVRAENDWTAAQAALYPTRLLAFCSFDPLADFALRELERCASTGTFRGLKLHLDESRVDLGNPEHVRKVRSVFKAANAHNLPIIIHVGNNRSRARANVEVFLDSIVAFAPNIPVQVAHLWGGGAYADSALTAYAERVHSGGSVTRNLYFDLASVIDMAEIGGPQKQKILAQVADRIREIGLTRVVFGTDGPGGVLGIRDAWQRFRDNIPLSDAELRTIAQNLPPYLK